MSMCTDSSSSSISSSSSSSSSSSYSNNVQVAVRVRPMNGDERKNNVPSIVSCHEKTVSIQHGVAGKKSTKSYNFDRVFGMYSSQDEVFSSIVRPIVDEVLAGFNCTIFAYGQTGTGKTHTMEGDLNNEENAGIVPRAVKSIFEQLESSEAEFTIRVSFLELYNEELQDLLVMKGNEKKLKLCEDERRGVVCQNLEEITVLTAGDIFDILRSGIQNRQTAATLCNKNSSRSHSIFTMKIMVKESSFDGEEVVRHGQLNLVDLAGSECVKRSGANEKQQKEAGNINQSLLTLGRVITALVDHHGHIPYRDSKLTRLLQESLGGKAKTCIIATLSPASSNIEETLSTLDYAHRARSIKNQPTVNQKMTKKVVLKEYCEEIEYLRQQLTLTREKNGVFMNPNDFYLRESKISSLESQLSECEGTLKVKSEELKQAKGIKDSLVNEIQELRKKNLDDERKVQTLSFNLHESENSLSLYKDYLRATQSVIAEQSCTENNLFASATSLQDEVSKRRAQLGSLFNKLDKARHCDQVKTAEFNSFVTTSKQKHSEISQSINQLTAAVVIDNRSSLESIDLLIEKARGTCNLLTSTMADVVMKTDMQISNGQQDMTVSCGQLNESLTLSNMELNATVQSLREDLFQWMQELRSQAEQMSETLDIHGSKIIEFQSEFSNYRMEQESSFDDFLNSERQQNSDTTKQLLDLRNCVSKLLSIQSEVAMQQAKKNNSEMTAKIKSIENYVSSQLNSLIAASDSSHESFVAAMDANSMELNASIETSTRAIVDNEASYFASTQNFVNKSNLNVQKQADSVSMHLSETILPSTNALRSGISMMSNSVDTKASILQDTCSSVLQKSNESLQNAYTKVQVLETAGKQTLQNVSGAIEHMRVNMASSIDGDFVKFLDSHGVGCKNQLSASFSSLQNGLSSISSSNFPNLKSSFEDFEKRYNSEEVQALSVGDTPIKSKSEIGESSIHLNKTRSHKVIISEVLLLGDESSKSKKYDMSVLLPQKQEISEEDNDNSFPSNSISAENHMINSHPLSLSRSSSADLSTSLSSTSSTSPRKRKGDANSTSSISSSLSTTGEENLHPNLSALHSNISSSVPAAKVPRVVGTISKAASSSSLNKSTFASGR